MRPRPFRRLLVVALVFLGSPARADTPRGPLDALWAEGWTNDGFIDPASGEGQRAQVAIDANGTPIAVWANRTVLDEPFQIVWSRFDGATWSPAELAFAPTPFQCESPRLSRAADGTLWLAWYEYENPPLNYALFTDLRAARFVDGAWELLPRVGMQIWLPSLDSRWSRHPDFAIHGVSREEAWVVCSAIVPGGSFRSPVNLYAVASLGGSWASPTLVRPGRGYRTEMSSGPGGGPVVFFSPDLFGGLLARAWDGATWVQGPGDSLTRSFIYEHAVQPDSAGAVRVVVTEELGRTLYGSTNGVREYVWDATGFRPGAVLFERFEYALFDRPDWGGLSLATSLPCAPCSAAEAADYRVFWVDHSFGAPPRILSLEHARTGIGDLDSPGDALEPATSWPQGAYDPVADRWYVVWTGPPGTTAVRRAKFAWTQEYAGDLAIVHPLAAQDTVRISIACTGDATAREFRVHRLSWPDLETDPPMVPPLPAAAVEVAESPLAGPCPGALADVVLPGRYVYYVELRSQGMLPAAYARSVAPVVVSPAEEPPPPAPRTTAFLSPYPQPAFGGVVTFPFELATSADVQLVIHDSRGRAVRRIELGALAAGSYRGSNPLRWDGRDDDGRRAAAGVYWARLWVDAQAVGDARRVVFAPGS